MEKKLRILSELVKLQPDEEFTIAMIVDRTQVNPQTVRTVLSRHSHLFEEAGKTETGRRGGQIVRYRLNPISRAELDRIAREDADQASTNSSNKFDSDCLAAVADTLLRQVLETRDAKRRRFLLELAAADLDTARREIEMAKQAREDTDTATAEWDVLNACYCLLDDGYLDDSFTSAVKKYIKSEYDKATLMARMAPATDLATAAAEAAVAAAANFSDHYIRPLLCSREKGQLEEIIAYLRSSSVDWMPLTPRNILLFGSSASLYYENALLIGEPVGPEHQGLPLNVMLAVFNDTIRNRQTKTPSPLEKALQDQVAPPVSENEAAYA